MTRWILAAAMAVAAMAAQAAETVTVRAEGSVAEAMDRLAAAVEAAGATVFARVDHAAGAQSVGMELSPMELLIFGNPKLGTPALQDAAQAGLLLPLRVLAYQDGDGATWFAYEDPAEMLSEVGIDPSADYVGKMAGALKSLTGKASGM